MRLDPPVPVKCLKKILSSIVFLLILKIADGQLRQMFVELNDPYNNNYVTKISMYSPSEGYISTWKWIGYTADSGHTFTKKYVTIGNVDYNGYNVNLTFGFDIHGIKAFNKDTLILYGDYGEVPSILYSTNQGTTYTLIYHTYLNPVYYEGSVTDMVFPSNGNVGYAVECDRIIKTTNRGRSWFSIREDFDSYITRISAVNDNTFFAWGTESMSKKKLIRVQSGGALIDELTPPNDIRSGDFISSSKGWINCQSGIYYTSNSGTTWTKKNAGIDDATSYYFDKVEFLDDSTGYAVGSFYQTYKTTDSGKIFELLPRDNSFEYFGFGHNEIFFQSPTQFWSGGHLAFLEMSTNAGGQTLPRASFRIDTSTLSIDQTVRLVNYSKPGYQYSWYRNDTLFATTYHASYIHQVNIALDSIKLVVTKGTQADTLVQYQYFNIPPPPPIPTITSFSPVSAPSGAVITIIGTNFSSTTSVKFGGTAAASFSVISPTKIQAIVANGATGDVSVTNTFGTGTLPGFTFLPAPLIASFSPTSGGIGTTVTISGANFTSVTSVVFGGVPATSFTTVNANTITAVVGTGASGNILLLSPYGNASVPGFTFVATPPVITSFFPASARANETITINGQNFSTTPSNNIVYFGAVRATVLNASTTSLAVSAPFGATYDLISVTNNTLTGYSSQKFNPIFEGTGIINPSSFTRQDFRGGDYFYDLSLVDIDNDGKPDVSASQFNTPNISVLKNNSTPGSVAFPPYVDIGVAQHLRTSTYVDMDGDGKKDIAGVNFGFASFSVRRNTSSIGLISFGLKTDYGTIPTPWYITGNDLDGDGKPDLVVVSTDENYSRLVSVYRSTTIGNNISFATRKDYVAAGVPVKASIVDIDGDLKPDIVAAHGAGVTIFRNTSTIGSINFATGVTISFPSGSNTMCTGDVDGDGMIDIVGAGYVSQSLSILRNTSTTGNISFAASFLYVTNFHVTAAAMGDLDGDSRPEIVLTSQDSNSVSIYKNLSSPGNINLSQKMEFATAPNPSSSLDIGDIDGDGKNDIVVGCSRYPSGSEYTVTILKNAVPVGPTQIQLCAGSSTTLNSSIAGNTFQWQQDNGGGFVNISENANFSGTNTPRLSLNNIPGAWNGYQYRCVSNSSTSNTYALSMKTPIAPTVSVSTPNTSVCAGNPVTFTATSPNIGTSPQYQWVVNGINTGPNSSVWVSNAVMNNDQVKLVLTTNEGCLTSQTATSNTLLMTVNIPITTSVQISSSNTDICSGQSVSFTASPTNGGATPHYQWQSSFGNVGTDSDTFSTSNLSNGSQVRVLMTSSIVCATPATVASNYITVNVHFPSTAFVSIGTTTPTACAGADVTFISTANNQGNAPIYQWKKNGINVGTNSSTYTTNTIVNGDVISLSMTSNLPCVTTPTVTSNTIAMVVTPSVLPGIAISGVTTVTQNQFTMLTASATNAGTAPGYQWQDSTNQHGWQNISNAINSTINYLPTLTGNKIRCILNSNAVCAVPASAVSSPLTFTVTPITWIPPEPSSNYGVVFYPNPVKELLVVDSLKLLDRWQTIDIYSVDGKQKIISARLMNQTRVSIAVGRLSAGVYVAILRKREGESVYFKFIKL